MDQQISIKKFFNICFTRTRSRTKLKEIENLECDKYIPGNQENGSECEFKTKTVKNSLFHKFISKNVSTSNHKKKKFTNCNFSTNDSEAPDIKPPLNSKKNGNKYFSCLKKNSSEYDSPIIETKLDLDSTTQNGFTEENSTLKETIPLRKPFPSQELEADLQMQFSHNSTIELMSRDGTLQLYSATTLTPLNSSAIQDEERIRTHLSISCFRPENYVRSSSSEGPDDVFEENDETSTSLASNFQNLKFERSKIVSENCGSRVLRNKKTQMNYKEECEYLYEDFTSKEDSLNFYSEEKAENIQTYFQKKIKNEGSHVPNTCPCFKTENIFSINSDVKQYYLNPPPISEESYQITSNVPSTNTTKPYHTCSSVTNPIPSKVSPLKKWILQLYFNSLVVAHESTYCENGIFNNNTYSEENKTESLFPSISYAQQNDSRIFGKTAQGHNSLGADRARISSDINSNAFSSCCRTYIPPSRICSNIKSEDEYFESFQTVNLGQPKKCDDHYYAEKENKLKRPRVKSVSTAVKSQDRARWPFRAKYVNSKPDTFSQDTTYTHYPFVDGPLAENWENTIGW